MPKLCDDPATNAEVKHFISPRYVVLTIVIMIGKVITVSLHLLVDPLILKCMKYAVLSTNVCTWT